MVAMQSSVFLIILGAFMVVHAYKNSPKGLHFVGVGYNLLKGNPEGGDLSNGGVDPGLLLTRKIFQLTWKTNKVSVDNKYKIPDQVIFAPRASCVTTNKKEVFSGPKSYQKKLNSDVDISRKYGTKLLKFAFTLSSRFQQVKRQTSKYHNVFYEEKHVCNKGRVRYQFDLAPIKRFPVSEDFAAAVCVLPGSYNTQAYFDFIEKWGTHMVVEVELGEKRSERYKSSSTEFTEYAIKNMKKSVSVSGRFMGYSGSLKVDVKTFRESMSQGTKFGKYKEVFKSGGANMPEPIGLKLVPITEAFDIAFYKMVDQTSSRCVHHASLLANRKGYVKRALDEYPRLKGAAKPVDPEVRIPLVWPKGTYGLPMPKSGCPKGSGFTWQRGTRFHDTEDEGSRNRWSSPYDLAGSVGSNDMERKFCMKTLFKASDYNLPWPKGQYCILKKGNCPAGFSQGHIQWDDEDTRNRNTYSGQLPDGSYDSYTVIYYCCRSDGHASHAIALPSDYPFVLLKSNAHQCQLVHGMRVRSEFFFWDCEDSDTNNSYGGHIPHSSVGDDIQIYYCYYYR